MSPSDSPIRVGLIGLSAGGGWAPVSHLPYLQSSSKYTITAICNSSIESGTKAIEQYNLSGSATAYDSVESMCDSDTVDLVVCVVVVFSHYKLVKPAIERGKDVYVGADNYKVMVKDYATGKIETVPMHEELSLPLPAQNVGMLYERFADGKFVPTFEDAVRRHEFLDAVFASNEDGGSVQKFTL